MQPFSKRRKLFLMRLLYYLLCSPLRLPFNHISISFFSHESCFNQFDSIIKVTSQTRLPLVAKSIKKSLE